MRERAVLLVGAAALAALGLFGAGCATPEPREPLPEPREVVDYLVQPGDVLGIKVFDAPELDQDVPVRPDGRFSASPLQDLVAQGRTLAQLDAAITQGLASFFPAPRVTVVVREFANSNVYVGGEVHEPGLVSLANGMTSLMAIFQAGGFKTTAQTTNVVVLRNGDREDIQVIKLDLKHVLTDSNPDLVLEPFDVVYVPKSKIARVNLFVEQYIKRMLPFALVGSANYTYVDGDTNPAAD